jgi:hypothetical protein
VAGRKGKRPSQQIIAGGGDKKRRGKNIGKPFI